MRKGAKRKDWTVAELNYLAENAGRISKRDICLHLRRSSKSVERKAAWLRSQGRAVTLRFYRPTLEPCPACGRLSGHRGKEGICEPCRRREQLATIHARIAELLPQLPLEERDTYERTEAETESRHDPLPKAPNTSVLSYYQKARAEEAYALALENAISRNLRRETKAAQKRKERIEKKVKSMGVCVSPQLGAKK